MEVLLIEDDLEDAGLTFEALRAGEVPCRISLVCDGEEAMEFLHRQGRYARAPRPDIILLDLNLPKKDGRAVLTDLRSDAGLGRIPVVVLTASAAHRQVLEEEKLYVESYMTKPVNREAFHAVVKSLRKYLLDDVVLPK
ncbi:MAG: response regulator [Patescibacteria group bacterium]|nr:response regulator [Patescibacteria group bacterium]